MSRTINAVDYHTFNKAMEKRGINDDTVHEWQNQVFIEIQGENELKDPEHAFWFKKDHENVLRLIFDDVEQEFDHPLIGGGVYRTQPIKDEQAEKLANFIKQHKGKAVLVHCYAGVARSGAIAQFAAEVNDVPLKDFFQQNAHVIPNRFILSKLRKHI